MQAGLLEDRPPGSVVREAVLTDEELTERQKQMLIEIYESFRKETAAAIAADAMDEAEAIDAIDAADAIEQDAESDLPPSEAELAWPEDVDPEAFDGGPGSPAISPVSSE